MSSDSTLPYYIQKAADLCLLEIDDGKVTHVNKDAVDTVMSTVRIVEKLQPSTIADRDETQTQEGIVLSKVLNSASGVARELWSQFRTAFGVGHGQELPASLWSLNAFRTIAKEIDLTFLGERTGKIISPTSLITGYENLPRKELEVPFSDFCTTISELSSPSTMRAFGDADSEWNTALDILKQKRVLFLYRETLYQASQYLKTDPNLESAHEFVHKRVMEGIGMLSGSIGNQGQVVDLTEAIAGDPGNGRLNWADYILTAKEQDAPVPTGVQAFDLDIEGGVARPRPGMARAGRLMVIAARTGVGKTALGVQVAASLAMGGLRVGFISAELDARSIEARIIANISKQEFRYHWRASDGPGYVTVGDLELPGATKAQHKVAETVAKVSQALQRQGGKILVEAPWGACVDACINTMRSMKAKDPELRAVVIDHFHALARHKGSSSTNPSSMLEDRAYKLMTAAKELDIDLFVLAQTNRVALETLGSEKKEPQLNEIRGTDALAHVAHAAWIVRRVPSDDNTPEVKRGLEVWHSKVRGRQAVWNHEQGILESVKGFCSKSEINLHYETATVETDDTESRIRDLKGTL